jgi:hypothetical protein
MMSNVKKFADLKNRNFNDGNFDSGIDVPRRLRDKKADLVEMILNEASLILNPKEKCDVYLNLLRLAHTSRKAVDVTIERRRTVDITTKNVQSIWEKANKMTQK